MLNSSHCLKDLYLDIIKQILLKLSLKEWRKSRNFLDNVIFVTVSRLVNSDYCPQTGSNQFKLDSVNTKF